ncbi:MAG: dihydroneopterin aldolase [Candidatus Thalassarchaeum sp.]|jgi:dihydroneopterin aldolase|nr:dihydroneopterin aldolase [Candidatus Thalassarchaeum sp.]MDB3855553.1 dihydroneopterin aldolase [Euryarchaeota archaeon]MDB4864777.1 dihydroneopterin aldolase [Euryarchaeota archaeon]
MTSLTDAITNILSSYQGVTTLFLEDIVRSVDIGVHDYEIGNPQRVRFDIYVLISGVEDPENDIIEDVLNYEYLLNSLEKVLLKHRFSLLESLANNLLDSILQPESVESATVVITKLDVLEGDGRLGCSMTRTK